MAYSITFEDETFVPAPNPGNLPAVSNAPHLAPVTFAGEKMGSSSGTSSVAPIYGAEQAGPSGGTKRREVRRSQYR